MWKVFKTTHKKQIFSFPDLIVYIQLTLPWISSGFNKKSFLKNFWLNGQIRKFCFFKKNLKWVTALCRDWGQEQSCTLKVRVNQWWGEELEERAHCPQWQKSKAAKGILRRIGWPNHFLLLCLLIDFQG